MSIYTTLTFCEKGGGWLDFMDGFHFSKTVKVKKETFSKSNSLPLKVNGYTTTTTSQFPSKLTRLIVKNKFIQLQEMQHPLGILYKRGVKSSC